MNAPRAVPLSSPPFAVGMVVTGLVCQELGASLAVLLFPALGPLGIVFLRLGFSAVILMIIARPSLRGHTPAAWRSVIGFGLVLALMNCLFYLALARLPLGVTVTIEVLGPLVLSVIALAQRMDAGTVYARRSLPVDPKLCLGQSRLGADDGKSCVQSLD